MTTTPASIPSARRSYSDQVRHMNSLIDEGVPAYLAEFMIDAERKLADCEDRVIELAAQITSDLARVVRLVEGYGHLNSSGELQSRGPNFDQACVLREAAWETHMQAVHMVNRAKETS